MFNLKVSLVVNGTDGWQVSGSTFQHTASGLMIRADVLTIRWKSQAEASPYTVAKPEESDTTVEQYQQKLSPPRPTLSLAGLSSATEGSVSSPTYTMTSPQYVPTSPMYAATSPMYAATSPMYTATSPTYPSSPAYALASPDYPPVSPADPGTGDQINSPDSSTATD